MRVHVDIIYTTIIPTRYPYTSDELTKYIDDGYGKKECKSEIQDEDVVSVLSARMVC